MSALTISYHRRWISALLLGGTMWGASLSGHVRITDSNEAAVSKKSDYSGVAVWLAPLAAEPPHLTLKHAVMLQKNKMFLPHILTIAAGTTVEFPNMDPIFHNAFSSFNGQIFDIGLYPPGSTRSVRFARPGIVRVFCNIHPTMSAVIVVVDSAFLATTGRDGSFFFAGVPPGEYELHFFHERATPETLSKLTKHIALTAAADAGQFEISETGYLPIPHKNKYGSDYPRQHGDSQGYGLPQ